MNHLESWRGVGFTFAIQDGEDGIPLVRVLDPWYNVMRPGLKMADTLQIKLRPYTSYTEAQEIADFINRRLENGNLPLVEVMANT